MPNGQDLVNSAKRFLGEPYSTAGGRCSQTSGYKDCSGLVSAALSGLGLFNACGTSTSIELWATRNGGNYVTRDFANRIPGVGLAIWGYSAGGHIGISAGNNMQIETPSAQGHKVGWSPMSHDRWGEYFTFPGITYDGATLSEPEKPKANPGVRGMTAQDEGTGWIWLVGPGNLSNVRTTEEWNQLKFIGVPHAGKMPGLKIVEWGIKMGATAIKTWDGSHWSVQTF